MRFKAADCFKGRRDKHRGQEAGSIVQYYAFQFIEVVALFKENAKMLRIGGGMGEVHGRAHGKGSWERLTGMNGT